MTQVTAFIQSYGLAAVFLSTFIEQLGLPLPSYPVLLLAGALSYSSGDPLITIVLVAAAGAVAGDLVCYAIGARFGRQALAFVCRFSLSRDTCVQTTERRFARIGPWTLLFAKFIPGLALVLIVLCGVTRVSLPLFVGLDTLGAIGYVTLPVLFGYAFHDAIDVALETLTRWGEYGVAVVAGGFALYLILRWIDRQIFIHQLKMDRISVQELARLSESSRPPLIFDVRSSEARSREGMIPGAVGADITTITELTKEYAHDAQIVIYCSCPNEASAATAARHLRRAGFTSLRPLLGGIEAWKTAGRPIVPASQ